MNEEYNIKYSIFRSLPHWTLLEFLSLTYRYYIETVERFDWEYYNLFNEPNCELYYRAILANVKPVSKNINDEDCYSPFDILEFFKKNGFDIHPEFEFTKKTSESGEIQYFWASDINRDADPVAEADQCLADDSQNTIGKSKTSDIETDDGKNKVIPGQEHDKKIEQDIKNIKISSVNESQITFQEPRKRKKFITYDDLDLMNVHLRAFKAVLENFPHYYKTGTSKDKKQYDKRQKQLQHINDMLLKKLFKEKLKFSIPSGYKLYELEKTKESGTYKFKFDIGYKDTEDHDESSKTTFIKKLDIAYQKHLDDPNNDYNFQKVIDLTKTGMSRGFLTEEEVKKYFEKDRLEDQFSEFEKENFQSPIYQSEDKK